MYDWSEEHQAIIQVMRRFVDEEIRPHLDDLEHNGMPPFDIIRRRSALKIISCILLSVV